MALVGPWPTQDSAGASIAATRRLISGEFQRPGILGAAPAVTGRADGAYNVGAFQAVTQRTSAGMERLANDGSIVAGDTLTAPPASNSRIEVIWVRSRFALLGDSVSTPEVGVTLGTAAASPTKPAIPAGALELATARRYSTDTTTQTVAITVTAPYTAPVGGVVPVRSQAELDALTLPDLALAGRLDTGATYVRRAGVWVMEPGPAAPHFRYRKTSSYSFTGTPTDHTWDATPDEGSLAGFTTSDRITFTCTIPGVYSLAGHIAAGASTQSTDVFILVNGATEATFNGFAHASYYSAQRFAMTRRFAVGDAFRFQLGGSGGTPGVYGAGTVQSMLNVDYLHG